MLDRIALSFSMETLISSSRDSTLTRRKAVTEMGKPTLPTKLSKSSILDLLQNDLFSLNGHDISF